MIDLLGMFAISWCVGMLLVIITYFICSKVKGWSKMEDVKLYAVYRLDVHVMRYFAKFPSREDLLDIAKVALLTNCAIPYAETKFIMVSEIYKTARDTAHLLSRDSELYMTYDPGNHFRLVGSMYVVCTVRETIGLKLKKLAVKDIYYKKAEGIDDLQMRLY